MVSSDLLLFLLQEPLPGSEFRPCGSDSKQYIHLACVFVGWLLVL